MNIEALLNKTQKADIVKQLLIKEGIPLRAYKMEIHYDLTALHDFVLSFRGQAITLRMGTGITDPRIGVVVKEIKNVLDYKRGGFGTRHVRGVAKIKTHNEGVGVTIAMCKVYCTCVEPDPLHKKHDEDCAMNLPLEILREVEGLIEGDWA